ncbi:bacteriorhodopsin [Capilliphycus salinus ALCB114379]|uniref:bacteriorhodopsin n=1 Tax=Capilliphycus salinus TaxID=2768948 RepID=UPI0039A6D3FB
MNLSVYLSQIPEGAIPEGLNLENLLTYSPLQHQLISHLLVLGVSAQAVGFVYFTATRKRSAPKYQPSSVLSSVVMVSAFLILAWQLVGWSQAFDFEGGIWRLTDNTFSNGYRYLNWSIDVPCLLTQMLFLLDVSPGQFRKTRRRFITAGLLMIYTGYIGQYFEVTNTLSFLIWGAVSTVFYIYILFLVGSLIFRTRDNLPHTASKTMGTVWILILISWTLYPVAYLMPFFWKIFPELGTWSVVIRQFLYTMADVLSKVIYGVLLSSIAQTRSAAEGYEPALKVQKTNENFRPDYMETPSR